MFYRKECPKNSIYPNEMPLIMEIYSFEYDQYGNEISGSIKGFTCFSQEKYYNLIYSLSNDTYIDLPNTLIDQNFLAKFIYINYRGEILAFNSVKVFVDYNNKTNCYKVLINIDKNKNHPIIL